MIKKFRSFLYSCYNYIAHKGFGFSRWKKQFALFGENSTICYPSILSGIEDISIADRTIILPNSRLQNYYQGNNKPSIQIGNHCYIGYYFSILNASSVTLGNDVLIASHVLISSENHGIDPETDTPYMNQSLRSTPVSIGDGCWIGEKACILPGVKIGKKCIIGANSVVTKSIPDYSIAVGNPAKVIKKYNFMNHQWESVL